MPKFSGVGPAKSFELDEAREFISFGTGFCWNSTIGHQTKGMFIDNSQLSRADFAYLASIRSSYVCCRCEDTFIMEHYYPHSFIGQFGFLQDIPMDSDFSIIPSSRIMLRHHQACIRYGTKSQASYLGQRLSLEKKFTQCFQKWWSKVFSALSGAQSRGNLKTKVDSLTKGSGFGHFD